MENLDNTEAVKYPEIAKEIVAMYGVDQEMRKKSELDDGFWDKEVDPRNTDAMKRIVEEIGWPNTSKVGKEVASHAWILVQHADHDPEFQTECLNLMKQESESEVDSSEVAYLEDRVCVNTKQNQVYGTQFNETRDEADNVISYEPRPIEDIERLDERRAKMGLEPFEEYRRHLTEKYYPHLLYLLK